MKVFVLALATSNHKSVIAALRIQGVDAISLSIYQLKHLGDESLILIPGVGNISHLCEEISAEISITDFRHLIAMSGHYVIGICLGFQFMCKASFENISYECLGLFPCEVKRIDNFQEVPSVGWKRIKRYLPLDKTLSLNSSHWVEELESKFFYFTHSYAVLDIPSNHELEVFHYVMNKRSIIASIMSGRYLGFQFHPEKSGENGLHLLKTVVKSIEANFLE